MKIVMIHNWCVDYAASGTDTHPVEYVSTEQASIDFEALARATREAFYAKSEAPRNSRFSFAGRKFDALDFFPGGKKSTEIDLPEFLTVDEWFAKYAAQSGAGDSTL